MGVESTVIDFVGARPRLLRAGGTPVEELEKVTGPICREVKSDRPLCPGMKYKHYAPAAKVTVVLPGGDQQQKAAALYDSLTAQGKKTVILALSEHIGQYADRQTIDVGKNSREYAHNLFAALRLCDKRVRRGHCRRSGRKRIRIVGHEPRMQVRRRRRNIKSFII